MDRGRCLQAGFLALVLLANGMVNATEHIGARYVDEDLAAVGYHARPGGKARFRAQLNAAIQRNPRDVEALVQRAYILHNAGDDKRARRDFDAALGAAAPGSDMERRVLWSRGWFAYDDGDATSALRDWQRAVQLHGGHPFWASYTYALAYWTLGQRDEALEWFDAAVIAMPEWGTEEGFARRIQHWKPEQRERMRALFEAWKQRSPATAGPASSGMGWDIGIPAT